MFVSFFSFVVVCKTVSPLDFYFFSSFSSYSASEKDSAYSEGELDDTPPARNRRHKSKIRRTGSRYDDAFSSGRENNENGMETVLQSQPLAHISRYGADLQERYTFFLSRGGPSDFQISGFLQRNCCNLAISFWIFFKN